MSKNLKLAAAALTEINLPSVDIRNVVLDVDKVTVNFSIKRAATSSAATLRELYDILHVVGIKAVLSFDYSLTKSIKNRTISLAQNFNKRVDAREKIIRADSPKFQGEAELFRLRNSDKDMFYEIPFSLTFEDIEEDIEHLTCVVFPYIANKSEHKNKMDAGDVSLAAAIDKGQPVTNGYVCYTPDEKIWTGETHKMPNGMLMTGRHHTKNDVPLRHERVSNSKFHNYRMFYEIADRLEQYTAPAPTQEATAEFSNIYLTRDQAGNVRMLFGVDCRAIFNNNANHTQFVDNTRKKIEEIRVIRYRSDLDNREEKQIVYSEDGPGGMLKEYEHYEKEKLVASIRETALQNTSSDIRYFTVTDHEFKESGTWQYMVEIDFQDATGQEVEKVAQNLKTSLSELKSYSAIASRSVNSSSNRFNQVYAESRIKDKTRVLQKCINSYIQGLSLYHITVDFNELARNLTNITFPKSGNADGLLLFQELVESLVYKLDTTLRKDDYLSRGKTTFESSVSHIKTKKNTFTISRDYSKIEEAYIVKEFDDIKLDFVYKENEIPQNSTGLSIVSKQKWAQNGGNTTPAFVRIKEKNLNLQEKSDHLVYHNFLFSRDDKEELSSSVLNNPLSQILRLLNRKSANLLTQREIHEIKNQAVVLRQERKEDKVDKYIDSPLFNKAEKDKKQTIDKTRVGLSSMEKEKTKSSLVLSELFSKNPLQDAANPDIEEVLYRAEILTGMGTSIADENWQPLTMDMLNNIQGAALIRLRANVVDFPFINEYFIVGSPQVKRAMTGRATFNQPKNTDVYSEFLNFSIPLLEYRAKTKKKYTKQTATPAVSDMSAPNTSTRPRRGAVSATVQSPRPSRGGRSSY